jgi:hypothetical protein
VLFGCVHLVLLGCVQIVLLGCVQIVLFLLGLLEGRGEGMKRESAQVSFCLHGPRGREIETN